MMIFHDYNDNLFTVLVEITVSLYLELHFRDIIFLLKNKMSSVTGKLVSYQLCVNVEEAKKDRQDVPFYVDNPDIRGGGIFVLVKDDIMAVRQTDLETDCEETWTKFDIARYKSVYVASFYRPHENDRHSLEELQKSLERICNRSSSHTWILAVTSTFRDMIGPNII